MLYKASTLTGYTLAGLDGEIGKVKEFYFDDQHWTIRYLVADTGNWLTGRKVLISPYSLLAVKSEEQQIAIDLIKQQIGESPSLDSEKPVSRQFEEEYHEYYGWPMYWGGPYMWGYVPFIERDREKWEKTTPREKVGDPHLRSTNEVRGYHIQATDGVIGHVEDFILDDETWAIRYLIIDTQNWWPGKKVLVSPRWIERVSWIESKVFIDLRCEAIKQSPEYQEESLLTRDYEAALHRHYNLEVYWSDVGDISPLQLKEEFNGNVLTVHVRGKLTAADYVHFVPLFERFVHQSGKLRVLFDMKDCHGWETGTLWEDIEFDLKHFADIERLALVGDEQWQEGMATFCKPFTGATIRYFAPADADAARKWLDEE